jgi:hypothetical protein
MACVRIRDSPTLFAAWAFRNDKVLSAGKETAVGSMRMIGSWAVLVCALIVPSAASQTSRGGISGTVADKSGAMVPDAMIEIEQKAIWSDA